MVARRALLAFTLGITSSSAHSQPSPVRASQVSASASKGALQYDLRGGMMLAFVDADVRRVIDSVLGEMLSVDYSVDPKVEGKITLRTAHPVARNALVPLLESALGQVGAVLLVQGGSYRVVPRDTARTTAPVITAADEDQASNPGYAAEVVPIKLGSARQIGHLLQQFLGKEIVASIDSDYNQIVISGSGADRRAARAMIRRLDVDQMAGMTFQLYKLDNVDPDSLLSDMEQIFQPPMDIIGTRVRLVPLPRLHAILGVAADRTDLGRIEPWIHKLDAGASSNKRRIYSYAIQNGRARDLANSLEQVLAGSIGPDLAVQNPVPAGPMAAPPPSVGSDVASSGPLGMGATLQPLLSTPQQSGSSSQPDQPSLPNVAAGTAGARVVPNDANNSLLIYANGEEYEFIRDVLDKIDRPVAQVLIQAVIAEVTLNRDLDYGVEWSFNKGNSAVTNSNHTNGTPTSIFPGFSYSYLGSNAQAVLNALQSKTKVRVLSTPKLVVLNNQTATLQVGNQVPIVTGQAQSVASAGAPIINNIELHDTGVILKVTPRVNDSGTVTLDIAQEVSDIASNTTGGIASPTIQQRRLTSTVSTRSGQMVALGGLIQDKETRIKGGIPVLSQIPVLGAAFGQHSTTRDRTELILLMTPVVMRSPSEELDVVDDLIDGLDDTRPLVDAAIKKQTRVPSAK